MKLILLILIIFLSLPVISQPFDETEISILEAQDKRDAKKITTISNNLDIKNYKLSEETINALANVADSNFYSVDAIMELYSGQNLLFLRNDTIDIKIQSGAAFALGQIPCSFSVDYLTEMETIEINEFGSIRTSIFYNILNSFGKIGDSNDLEQICKYEFDNDSLNGALALSIARFGLGKIKIPAAFEKLKKLSSIIKEEDQRKWVAYAFNSMGDKETLNNYLEILESISLSSNPFCRMWAISAIGKTGNPGYTEFIMKRYNIEKDWRVKVNMLNAIGNLDIDESSISKDIFETIMHSAVDDVNSNVSITACKTLVKICLELGKANDKSLILKEYFEHYIKPDRAIESFIQNEMITTLAKIFKDDYKSSLFSLFSQAEGYDRKSAVVSAFQYMDDPMVYKELRDSISADVQRYNKLHPNKDGSMIGSADLAKMYRAFVEALSVFDEKMDDENKNIVRLIYSEFSTSKNTAITDICLSKLADSMYSKYWKETGQIMLFDFGNYNEKSDKDIMLLYIDGWGKMKTESAKETLEKMLKSSDYDIAKASADAIKQITGKDYSNNITASRFTFDWDWNYINNLDSKKIAEINTDKGIIKIELFPQITPFTVQSFVKLGEKGFYNGTIFHRVVPNFVIQGGDPTGTGYGGPGYSIRTEIADIGFDSYYVGMASSGKDTEGSQFFITHSPQPHLDGKYTIFGKVTEGFDAVDKIVIGDRINNISFSSR